MCAKEGPRNPLSTNTHVQHDCQQTNNPAVTHPLQQQWVLLPAGVAPVEQAAAAVASGC